MASLRTWFNASKPRVWLKRAIFAGTAGLLGLIVLFIILYLTIDLPSDPPQPESAVLLDANGDELATLFGTQNRIEVPLSEISDNMEKAAIAAEDRKFYEHGGLDPFGIARAFVNDVRGGRLQGGSTITQQLVKNTYLDNRRTVVRKAREAVLAVKVEQELSKEEILERYLNVIYIGRGSYGIEVAAQNYFGKPAAKLTLAESALIAGLISSPESGQPDEHPEKALRLRNQVLDGMVETEAITRAQAKDAKALPIKTVPRKRGASVARTGGSAHFVEEVRKWAVNRYGEKEAYTGGLRIHTTLDIPMQKAAEAAVTGVLNRPDDPEVALVALDDKGAIKAMIGGRDFNKSKVNLALGKEGGGSGRQAGSAFKPFVLATAIDQNISVRQKFPAPASITLQEGSNPWIVHNYDNEDFGETDLIDGTVHSVNTVYAQLILQTGAKEVGDMAKRLGIQSDVPPVPSVALGSASVSPLDMARAFMVFAARGEGTDPYYVIKVTEKDGDEIYKADVETKRVLKQEQADLINYILGEVPKRGTAEAARIGRPMAGKTGTTTDYVDAWLVAYTPKLGAAVWMGYPEGSSRPMTNVHGRRVTGGSFPSEIWKRFMSKALKGKDALTFVKPPAELLNAPTSTTTSSTNPSASSTSSSTSSTNPPTSTTQRNQPTTSSTSSTTTNPN